MKLLFVSALAALTLASFASGCRYSEKEGGIDIFGLLKERKYNCESDFYLPNQSPVHRSIAMTRTELLSLKPGDKFTYENAKIDAIFHDTERFIIFTKSDTDKIYICKAI